MGGGPADPPGHPQASILRGAALVYVLPLFCLLLGALLGQLWLVPLLSAGGVTILCCLLGGHRILLVRYFLTGSSREYGPRMLGGAQYPSSLLRAGSV